MIACHVHDSLPLWFKVPALLILLMVLVVLCWVLMGLVGMLKDNHA